MRPVPITAERAGVVSALAVTDIVRVEYWCLNEELFVGTAQDGSTVHEVAAVDLTTAGGHVVRVNWAQLGESEGVDLEVNPEEPLGPALAALPASELPAWRDVIGRGVPALRLAWQLTGPEPTVWAIGLDSADGSSATIALGEVTDDGVAYMPDSLIVLSGVNAAMGYEIPASSISSYGSAWGAVSDG